MSQRKLCTLKSLLRCLLIGSAALLFTGCNKSSTGGTPPRLQGTQDHAPKISGTPLTAINAGNSYSFQPSASDPDGDGLSFSISNQPAWTTFDAATGRLTGIPGPDYVGVYSGIAIRVSDGTSSVQLPAFSIAVTQISTGTATVSWQPPTENTDGSALTDLAGFRIYYGTSLANLSQSIDISNPGITAYVVEDLYPATWYFRVRAYAADNSESSPSNAASKTIL
jgi:hypothetical protein